MVSLSDELSAIFILCGFVPALGAPYEADGFVCFSILSIRSARCICRAHRSPPDTCDGRTIVALTVKVGNANTKASTERSGLFSACECPLDTHYGRTIVALTVKAGNANTESPTKVGGYFFA